MTTLRESIGARIRKARGSLTQMTVAERMRALSDRDAAVDTWVTHIYRWEKGIHAPNVEQLLLFAKACEVDPKSLLEVGSSNSPRNAQYDAVMMAITHLNKAAAALAGTGDRQANELEQAVESIRDDASGLARRLYAGG